MRIAYFDCFSGVSGDMCLGALVSAGWPAAELEALPARLKLENTRVEIRSVRRGAFAATKVDVRWEGSQPHRHLHHLEAMVEAGDVPAHVKERAKAVFRRLAEAEAEVHGTTVQKVHFHEVGAVDALVDVVGTVLGLDVLGIEKVQASALPLGGGFVQSEHGRIPVPAPATALLLRGAPVASSLAQTELVTPTGAALLTTLVSEWGLPRSWRLDRIGTGAGERDLTEQPNVLRLMVGETEPAPLTRRSVVVLETAIDDENPQYVADLLPRLLEAGALDAMLVPAIMKKGRAGSWLVVLAEPEAAEKLTNLILRESSTLGVRMRTEQRVELERRSARVTTEFGPVDLKVAIFPDGEMRAVPEFESVRAAAISAGRSLREVADAAVIAWRQTQQNAPQQQ